jgi:hypothetical protein
MSQINPFVACIELSRYAKSVGVAFRIKADGTIETDSVEEAMKVRAAFLKESRKQAGPDRALSEQDNFSEDTKRFLYAIAGGGSYTSEDIAEGAKISTRSIPPIIRGLNSWAKRRGLKLDELLIRTQTSVKGKPVSTYEMTDEFCEKLGPILGANRSGNTQPEQQRQNVVQQAKNVTLTDLRGTLCQPHGKAISVSASGGAAVCHHGCVTADLKAYAASLNERPSGYAPNPETKEESK